MDGFEVGLRERVVGREQAGGERVEDLGEPVLAIDRQERDVLGPRQGLGLGMPARGELDGRQLGPELRGPRAHSGSP